MPPRRDSGKKRTVYVKTRGGKVVNRSPRKVTRTGPTGPRGNTGPTGPKGRTDSTGRRKRSIAGVKAKGQVKIRPRQKYGKEWYGRVKKTATAGPSPLEQSLVHRPGKPLRTDTAQPVLTILNQFNRPISGVTRGILEGSKRGSALDAVKGMAKGLAQNKNSTADIYRKLGASRKLSAALGFPTDIALDPTTYLTLGGATVARHAATAGAEESAKRITKKALKAGLDEQAARNLGKTAARKTAREGAAEKAIVVEAKMGGRRIARKKFITGRGITGLAEKQPSKVAEGGRKAVSHVRPTMRPTSAADRMQFASAQHGRAIGRAINNNAAADAQHTGEQLAKRLKSPRDQVRVAHAVDTGDFSRLPGSYKDEGSLYRAAVDIRSHLRYHNRLRARTPGVSQGTIYDYFPHMKESSIRKGKASDPMETAQAQVDAAANPVRPGRPSTTRVRKDRRTLAQKNYERTGVSVIRTPETPPVMTSKRTGEAVIQPKRQPSTYDPTPAGINARTYYHGSGTKGLTREAVDTSATNEANLMGQAFYITDARDISAGYKKARSKGGEGATYEVKLGVKKPLDMESKADPAFAKILASRLSSMTEGSFDDEAKALIRQAEEGKITNDRLYKQFKEEVSIYSHHEMIPSSQLVEDFQMLADDLRKHGWDSLVYVGGKRTGNTPHQVVAVLDRRAIREMGPAGPETGLRVTTHKPQVVKPGKPAVNISVTQHAPKADKFSTDPAVVMGNYELQTGKLLEKGHEINTVRKLGRPVEIRAASNLGSKKSTRVFNVGPLKRNEVVVHIDNKRGITTLTSEQVDLLSRGITKRRTAGGGMEDVVPGWKAGSFRVVDKSALDEALMPAPVNSSWWSKHVVHGWKSIATATPMFHFRNFVGDTERLYTVDPGIGKKIPRLYGESTQSLRYIRQTQGVVGKKSSALARRTRADKEMVNLGKSGKVTIAAWAKELKDNGIVQIGQRGSELRDIGGGAKGVTKRPGRIRRGGRRVNEVLQDRENLTYVAGYKHFREKGLGPEEARRRTMDALYDYGHVTPTERKLRGSVFPFYTFQARTPPYYAKTAVQRPGKIAGIEHLRRNAGIYFGQDDRSLSKEPDYMQRAGGIPIGGGKWLSYGSPAAQGLNELPGALSPKEQLKEWARYGIGSMGPWAKAFPEAGPLVFDQSSGGYNYFFGSPIQSPYGPLVPAPGLPWEKLSPALRKKIGVYEFTEKKSGKKVWGWKGWKQYAMNIVTPGTPGFALRIGQEITQRGQTRGQQALNFATGMKIDNSNVYGALISKSYDEKNALELKNNELRQRGLKESKQYKKNAKQIAELDNLIAEAGRLRGDKQTVKKKGSESLFGRSRGRPRKGSGSLFGKSSGSDSSESLFGK